MMSKYFQEVEFELPKDPGENPDPPQSLKFDSEKLTDAINEIRSEIEKIRRGESNLTTYAIDPGDFSFPTGNRLSIFHREPTLKNFTGLIEIAKQDLGVKAAKFFTVTINKAREEEDK